MAVGNSAAPVRDTKNRAVVTRVLLIGKEPQLTDSLEKGLTARNCVYDYAAGSADALRRLRQDPYAVVITDPRTGIEEDLALLDEMRAIRPGVRPSFWRQAARRKRSSRRCGREFFCAKPPPLTPRNIADYAEQAAASTDSLIGIEVLSAHRDWISLRINSQLLTAERLVVFLREMQPQLAEAPREELMLAFREILINAIEHGAEFRPGKVIDVAAVHTKRTIVFYVHDPGSGFRWESLEHAAIGNPDGDAARHIQLREEKGIRPEDLES